MNEINEWDFFSVSTHDSHYQRSGEGFLSGGQEVRSGLHIVPIWRYEHTSPLHANREICVKRVYWETKMTWKECTEKRKRENTLFVWKEYIKKRKRQKVLMIGERQRKKGGETKLLSHQTHETHVNKNLRILNTWSVFRKKRKFLYLDPNKQGWSPGGKYCQTPTVMTEEGAFFIPSSNKIKKDEDRAKMYHTVPMMRNQFGKMLTYADVCWRMLTYADVCWRMLTYADVCWRSTENDRYPSKM